MASGPALVAIAPNQESVSFRPSVAFSRGADTVISLGQVSSPVMRAGLAGRPESRRPATVAPNRVRQTSLPPGARDLIRAAWFITPRKVARNVPSCWRRSGGLTIIAALDSRLGFAGVRGRGPFRPSKGDHSGRESSAGRMNGRAIREEADRRGSRFGGIRRRPAPRFAPRASPDTARPRRRQPRRRRHRRRCFGRRRPCVPK